MEFLKIYTLVGTRVEAFTHFHLQVELPTLFLGETQSLTFQSLVEPDISSCNFMIISISQTL